MSDLDTSDFSADAINSAVAKAYGKTTPPQPVKSQPPASTYAPLINAAATKYGIDPNLLSAVVQTESSGNPNATSKDENGNPVAHGLMQLTTPTATSLGVDPYNPAQAIDGGARLLKENLDASNGDVTNALKMYHGGTDTANWGPKTNAYPGKVQSNMPKSAQNNDPSADFSTEAIQDAVNKAYGRGNVVNSPDNTSTTQSAPQSIPAQASNPNWPSAAAANFPGKTENRYPPVIDAISNMLTGMVAKPVSDVAGLAARGVEMATGNQNPGGPEAFKNYVQNALTSDLHSKQAENIAKYNPLSMIGQGVGYVGQGAGNLVKSIAPDSVSVQMAGNAVSEAIPQLVQILGAKAGMRSPEGVPSAVSDIPARIEPTLDGAQSGGAAVPAQLADVAQGTPNPLLEAMSKPRMKLHTDGSVTPVEGALPPTATPVMQSGAPAIAAHEASPVVQFTIPPKVTDPRTVLPAEAQQDNIATMQQIGLDTQRGSAITGNPKDAGVEYHQGRLTTPQGDVMTTQLNKEQIALKNYAQQIIQDTGATAATQPAAGAAIKAPLHGLSDYFDNEIGKVYDAADAATGSAASVQPTSFERLLNSPDFKETLLAQDKQGLLDATNRQLQRFQGLLKDSPELENEAAPNTVKRAESFRKWLNKQWTPENSYIIGQMKEALDGDVAAAGGEETYKAARALHELRKNTLDNPNGISALLSEEGPNGINQKVPDEKVGSKLMEMPDNQFQHIVTTLKNLPPEIQALGTQALAEIKGALAQKIYAAGDSGGTQAGPSAWNAANVTKALNSPQLNGKLKAVFSPEELQRFITLNKAGHILQTPSSYPGSAVQGHNLVQKGMIYAPPAAGASLGAFLGTHIAGPIGTLGGGAAGNLLGSRFSTKMANKFEMENANKLQQQLQNPQVVTGK